MTRYRIPWGWVLVAMMAGYIAGTWDGRNVAYADATTRSERALERIARAIESRCK